MQADVSICTPESDIKVVRGTYIVPHLNVSEELALASVKYLYTDINDVREHYFRLGFHLREFDKRQYYYFFGYSCLADFACVNLGMDASAVSRCISVFEKFCKRTDSWLPTMFIQDEYVDFSYSQLVEMVSIKDEKLIRSIKPDMTVKEIRDIKKRKKLCSPGDDVSRENEDVSQIATSQKNDSSVYLSCSDMLDLKGAALCARIKKVEPVSRICISLFDFDGKSVYKYLNCDVLKRDCDGLVLRIVPEDANKDV